jgi:bacillithiol biosynthesis cysteine-adding enzyme BshC
VSSSTLLIHSSTAEPFPAIALRDPVDLSHLAEAFSPGNARDRLLSGDALAVTTGQQPGLFGGPLYTVHKALAARGLAIALERKWGRPVVPVFWLAGDDHDWTEATNTAWWSLDGEQLVQKALPSRPHDAPQLPMSNSVLGDEVVVARDELAAALPAGEDRDRTIAWLERHWYPDNTVHKAYCTGMAELFEPLGIACFDATAPSVKNAQIPHLRNALEKSQQLDRILAELPDAGTGIEAGSGATLVFIETADGRDRLLNVADGFTARRSELHWTEEELFTLLDTEPQRFSANVLLRPVVESALLPTVAYVAGPGEYRYLTKQAEALYQPLETTPQQPVKRWGGTVIDSVSARLLDRLDLSVDQMLEDDGTLGHRILLRDMPANVSEQIELLRAAINSVAAVVSPAATEIDPVMTRAVEARRRKFLHTADDLQHLIERHLRKRDDIAFSQFKRLNNRLMPANKPQERVLGVAAALGRWGHDWLNAAAVAAEDWAAEELVVPTSGS